MSDEEQDDLVFRRIIDEKDAKIESLEKVVAEYAGMDPVWAKTLDDLTDAKAEIEQLKDLVREAFNVGWDSREQVITTRRVQGREHVFTAWLDQVRARSAAKP